MKVADAYSGVKANRILTLRENNLLDRMTINCEVQRQIDWFFHCAGTFETKCGLTSDTLPEKENGYSYFTNVRRVSGDFTATYTIEKKTLVLKFTELPESAVIYIAESPDYPANIIRTTVMVRVCGKSAVFAAHYEVR